MQHDHVTASGPVGERLRQRGFDIDEIMVVTEENYDNPNVDFEFPDVSGYDLVVPMGAPWGAWDDGCIGNWLTPELEWVRSTIEADIPVLGICFGGQLIARALGGTVARGAKSEIGWTAIHSDDTSLVSNGPWFQFHYDQWTMPEGAVEIARNPVAPQAFTYGRSLAESRAGEQRSLLSFHPRQQKCAVFERIHGMNFSGNRHEVADLSMPRLIAGAQGDAARKNLKGSFAGA